MGQAEYLLIGLLVGMLSAILMSIHNLFLLQQIYTVMRSAQKQEVIAKSPVSIINRRVVDRRAIVAACNDAAKMQKAGIKITPRHLQIILSKTIKDFERSPHYVYAEAA